MGANGVQEWARTKFFFYEGMDGLSFYLVHGRVDGGATSPESNNINMDISVIGNTQKTQLRVEDDPGEITSPIDDVYEGRWTVEQEDSDGLVIGPFDQPSEGAAWSIILEIGNMGTHEAILAEDSSGNRVTFFNEAGGMQDTYAGEKLILSPMHAGCYMSYKQIEWLERGHRTGAACSCSVIVDGQKYIVSKRSIGTDMTCGGGESLSNPCVALWTSLDEGHPAIAWPTLDGDEFAGMPTSGSHGFVRNNDLSDAILEKIANGEIDNVNGDPAANIPFIIFPVTDAS
jgi:hypothetical protein